VDGGRDMWALETSGLEGDCMGSLQIASQSAGSPLDGFSVDDEERFGSSNAANDLFEGL
jgi:hypothetical protein